MSTNGQTGTRVLVLGGSGMLGSMIVDQLARDSRLDLIATARSDEWIRRGSRRQPRVEWKRFDALDPSQTGELARLADAEWVINAIGITKPLIHDDDAAEREAAARVNILLPHRLAELASRSGARVVQIATDCVYSGASGGYSETAPHDALDVYGKTKSLGEVPAPRMHHLRCSIFGPEPVRPGKFLLEWFLAQPRGAVLRGFVNHRWNGVTTFHFARLCRGILARDEAPPALHHVIPSGHVTKHELLQLFAAQFDRGDIVVEPVEAPVAADRTLSTNDETINRDLWRAAGYDTPPTIAQMVTELAATESVT